MVDLSLCMIVRNEAERLAACLESVAGLIDELIVVDTGSTDATIAIAKAAGAHVYEVPWQDDFAAARNASLAYATGAWVLVLDADEVLLPGVLQALAPYRAMADVVAISLRRHELGAQQAPYSQILRLFRRHSAIYFERPYHEGVDDSIQALQSQEPHWRVLTVTDVAIEHSGYTAPQIAAKTERARRIMSRYLAQHPDDLYLANKFGALLIETGEISRGSELLLKSTQASEPLVQYEAHYHLALAASQRGDIGPAQQHYELAIATPNLEAISKLSSYYNLATILEQHGDREAAHRHYETVRQLQPDFAPVYVKLGQHQRSLGHLNLAIEHYCHAIDLDPDYAPAFQSLGVALFKLGHIEDSLNAFRRAISLYDTRDPDQAEHMRQAVQGLFKVTL